MLLFLGANFWNCCRFFDFFFLIVVVGQMECVFSSRFAILVTLGILLVVTHQVHPAVGIRFVIDRDECFSHSVPYEGDMIHVSFVVIKSDSSWHYTEDGVDLVV